MRGVYPAEYGQMPEGDTSIGSIFSELNRKKLWIFLPTLLAFLGAAVFVIAGLMCLVAAVGSHGSSAA